MKFTKREAPKNEGIGASNFLKVADGQSVQGVFRGEVHEFYQSWPRGGEKQIFDKPTPGASSRFRLNFVTQEDGKFVAKVWEFGLTVYNQLAEISEAYPLEVTKVKISRRGVDKNTQWMIIPLGPVDKKALPTIEAVNLNILNGQATTQESAPEKEDDEIPF